ncbi:sensor histidine kinase KdpD [Cellulophaga sp. L1A9]|uniref:sensor histidine kinase n=1 Tax=Cellulophaga sp. L1A9 TaxID=2686362 RepID=UPI00131E6FE0|nr:HAMP domain-containing sensor histidine kinase [Cellulophaga sp. L1A9]
MFPLKNKLHHPVIIVLMCVSLSTLGFLITDFFAHWGKFWEGLYLSIFLPIFISTPIAIIIDSYFKKIKSQNIELEQLDTINKKLFLLISHDVRSPLASLKGIINLITNNDLEEQESKMYLKQLSDKLDNLDVFLNGLLEWSQKQTQNKPLDFINFDALEVIKPTINLLEHAIENKNIITTLKSNGTTLYADKESFSFVFRNVLHNAIKFTGIQGRIHVETSSLNGEIHIIIKDNGVGISEEEIHKILNGSNWYTTKGTSEENGSGFGLRSCFYYLEKNNGRLKIESELGSGSTFTIVLPEAS